MDQSTFKVRQWQLREDMIIDATRTLLASEDYAELSMDAIAAKVGISKKTLYLHFQSKEELAVQVMVRALQRTEQRLQEQERTLPAIDQLERALRQSIEDQAGLTIAFKIAAQPEYKAHLNRLRDALMELIEKAKAEGDIRPELPTPAIVGLITRMFRDPYADMLPSCPIQEISDAWLSIILHGIRHQSEST
ncbi:MAG: TetR/AcrR family transcriptional regulator [Ktedonobacterales bacterium]